MKNLEDDSQLSTENDEEENDDFQVDEYDLTSTPNDFNILTINNFIESGAIVIPGFQRNFVWDLRRASKLIESIILGLPVPQIFLYEESKNKFLVIDGQQRLMSIFYFIRQRFPKKEKRTAIREIFSRESTIPDEVLYSDEYFTNFKLSLTDTKNQQKNKFNGLTYKTLGEYRTQFELRPIRNVIVKQNVPKDDKSSVFEIFNRLNSGGMNLTPQEIRSSLYHSEFYNTLYKLNLEKTWRGILDVESPDLHMRDIEILLRGFAILTEGDKYNPSLAKFLNNYSNKTKGYTQEDNKYFEDLFKSFLFYISDVPDESFINKKTRRFNTFLFEAILYATGQSLIVSKSLYQGKINLDQMSSLSEDKDFLDASVAGTTNKQTVAKRLEIAQKYFNPEING